MSDPAMKALTEEIVRLSGIIHEANDARDKAKAERDAAVRSEQELRGIVMTYGLVELDRLFATDEVQMRIAIPWIVLRAAGPTDGPMLFVESLRKALTGAFASRKSS